MFAEMYILTYTLGMSRRYSLAEARASLPQILDEADAGIAVELTRRGRPVAVVVSRRDYDRLRATRGQFADTYSRFVARFDLKQVGLEEDLVGPRSKSHGRKVSV